MKAVDELLARDWPAGTVIHESVGQTDEKFIVSVLRHRFVPVFHRGVDRIRIVKPRNHRYRVCGLDSKGCPQGMPERLDLVRHPRDPSGYEGSLIGSGSTGQPAEPLLFYPPCFINSQPCQPWLW